MAAEDAWIDVVDCSIEIAGLTHMQQSVWLSRNLGMPAAPCWRFEAMHVYTLRDDAGSMNRGRLGLSRVFLRGGEPAEGSTWAVAAPAEVILRMQQSKTTQLCLSADFISLIRISIMLSSLHLPPAYPAGQRKGRRKLLRKRSEGNLKCSKLERNLSCSERNFHLSIVLEVWKGSDCFD